MEDGVVKSRITKVVVQGEARVGKSSVKCLLVTEVYTNSTSTGCIEPPSVAIKRYGYTEKWVHYNEEEMEITVISEIQLLAETKIWNVNDPIPEGIKNIVKHEATGNIPAQLPSGEAQPATHSTTDSATQEEPVHKIHSFYKRCKENKKKGAKFEGQSWLYFIDSGGQTQFQKLLPAFMPFASILLLVVSLSKNLSDPASTMMQLPEEKVSDGVNSLSVAEMLKQLLSAIASSAEHYRSLIHKDPILSKYIKPPSDKLQILPIATHRDEYEEALKSGKESINDKEKELNDILMCHMSTCEVIRQNERFHLYEVDGRKAQDPDVAVDPDLHIIAQALEDNAYEVKVPLKWYCYGILLHDVAKEGCGILSLSYCQKLGQQLSLPPDQSLSAIKFHSLLNNLLYFPDSRVYDLVFVKLESLINIIKDLVVFIYKARSNLDTLSIEAKALTVEGRLSVNILKRISDCFIAILQSFPDFEKKLFYLFEDLLIAAQLPDGQFLMPALLPIRNMSNFEPFSNAVPLLLYFKKAVPIGLFCAIIVHLISRKENPWKIDKRNNFSNYFKLRCKECLEGSVDLVEMLDCIALYCQSPNDYVIARDALEEAVDVAMTKHKLSKNDKPCRAFYCPCQKEKKHIAIATWFERRNCYYIYCTIDEDFKVESHDFLLWLSQNGMRKLILFLVTS